MILYKYLQPARLDVLRTKRIRFTQPGDFNDPFEFRPRIESTVSGPEVRQYVENNFDRLLEEELSKYGSLVEVVPKDTLKLILSAQKTNAPQLFKLLEPEIIGLVSPLIDKFLNQSVGVLCLSEIRDSLLMWGHYTENHTGLVVGFDSEHPFFSKRKTEQDEFAFCGRFSINANVRRLYFQTHLPRFGFRQNQKSGRMKRNGASLGYCQKLVSESMLNPFLYVYLNFLMMLYWK
jgi:hypothetical protein